MLSQLLSEIFPDLIMEMVTVNQNITVSYHDLSPENVLKSQSAIVVPSHRGSLSFVSSGEQIGDIFMKPARLTYNLTDMDLNVDPVREESVTIMVSSSDSSQSPEALLMTENGINSGTFTADLRLTIGSFNGLSLIHI